MPASEPIVHYKKDCDYRQTCSSSRNVDSEPIVHYKKDCDEEFAPRGVLRLELRTHRPLQEGLRPIRAGRLLTGNPSQNPSSTTRRIATYVQSATLGFACSQNPSSTTRRIATLCHFRTREVRNSQNPSSTTRRIATIFSPLVLHSRYLRTHRPLQEGLRLVVPPRNGEV